jgi:transcriptional regulator with XRE-family HTH domain
LTRTRGSESIGSIAEGEGHGSGGQKLRVLREKLGLTMRDIETASEPIARNRHNEEHLVPISRLSDFETKGVIPSIYRLYSLAVIYRRDLREILLWYGVGLEVQVSDLEISAPPKSHLSNALANMSTVQMPVRMDPGFDPRKTLNFGRMAKVDFTHGYIDTEELAMYPRASSISTSVFLGLASVQRLNPSRNIASPNGPVSASYTSTTMLR